MVCAKAYSKKNIWKNFLFFILLFYEKKYEQISEIIQKNHFDFSSISISSSSVYLIYINILGFSQAQTE